jgi:hypothetical protein
MGRESWPVALSDETVRPARGGRCERRFCFARLLGKVSA